MRRERDALLSLQLFFAGLLPEPWDVRTSLEAGEAPERPFALIELAGPGDTTGGGRLMDRALVVSAGLFPVGQDTREAALDAALDLRETVWQAVKWGPDPKRPTTDLIALYAYEPRVETHRFKVAGATGGTFTATVNGHATAPLPPTANASQLAAAIATAISAPAGAITGTDRGAGLWDINYGGDLAGGNIGAPAIDGSLLTGSRKQVLARTMLEGAPAPWRTPSDFMRVQSFTQTTLPDSADPTLVMVAVDLRLTFARGLPLPFGQRILQRISATVGSGSEA